MYTIRGMYFVEAGVSTVIFILNNSKELEKTKQYEGYLPYMSDTIKVYGAEVQNPEVI